jgi:hypothetical protein
MPMPFVSHDDCHYPCNRDHFQERQPAGGVLYPALGLDLCLVGLKAPRDKDEKAAGLFLQLRYLYDVPCAVLFRVHGAVHHCGD